MANKNIVEDGKKTRFSSTRQPPTTGRRPNVYAKYVKEERVSLDDQKALFESILAYKPDVLKDFLKDEKDKPPIGVLLLLNAIKSDISKGEIFNYEKLMDRTFGKPEKTVNKGITQISPEVLDVLNNVFNPPQKKEKSAKSKTTKRKPKAK